MGKVAKRVMTGEDLGKALKHFADKYDSPLLSRTFEIFIGELTSGGEIAFILEKIVANMRERRDMHEEMVASTTSYMIFISIIVVFIAPVLFGLSYELMSIISKISQSVGQSIHAGGSPVVGMFHISTKAVDVEAYKGFSVLAIVIISSIAGVIMSVIQKGSVKEGIKYIPFFIGGSLATYLFTLKVLGAFFGGIGI